ncbi:MAG: hypothetical protein HOP15_08180 [Planctomycetes bacterium]|nr:hypothetical protein [Planctomycetota bacterium]
MFAFHSPAARLFGTVLIAAAGLACSSAPMRDIASDAATDAGARFGHKSTPFAGAKANQGFVTHVLEDGKSVLVLSDDFVVPETPAPHWQLVDSRGNAYLLNRLKIKGDRFNKTVVIPPFVHDVARVQIWCAFAETVLGEASFEKAVR